MKKQLTRMGSQSPKDGPFSDQQTHRRTHHQDFPGDFRAFRIPFILSRMMASASSMLTLKDLIF
jgi:hypothetical protein